MRLTRRELAALTSAALSTAAARAQAPPKAANPAAELAEARDQVKAIAAALEQIEISMSTEPAFAFHP